MAEEGEIGIVVNEMDDDLYDYDRVGDVEEETEMDDDADSVCVLLLLSSLC